MKPYSKNAPEERKALRVGVVIATKGRSECVPRIISVLESQTSKPDTVIFSVTETEDLPSGTEKLYNGTSLNILSVCGPSGSCVQRNTGIDMIIDSTDIIIFIDDDFVLSPGWIENSLITFKSDSRVVGVSGILLKDGAVSGPLTWDNAFSIISSHTEECDSYPLTSPIDGNYGCGMAFRCSAIQDLRFDERLVLYGWLEDSDFSRRLARSGTLVRCRKMFGVHLGIQKGRVSGKRFGYSQIVNPFYLMRKGVLGYKETLKNIVKSLGANAVKSFRPEPHVDRIGRLVGNLMGLLELASFRCRPERVTEID